MLLHFSNRKSCRCYMFETWRIMKKLIRSSYLCVTWFVPHQFFKRCILDFTFFHFQFYLSFLWQVINAYCLSKMKVRIVSFEIVKAVFSPQGKNNNLMKSRFIITYSERQVCVIGRQLPEDCFNWQEENVFWRGCQQSNQHNSHVINCQSHHLLLSPPLETSLFYDGFVICKWKMNVSSFNPNEDLLCDVFVLCWCFLNYGNFCRLRNAFITFYLPTCISILTRYLVAVSVRFY